MKKAALICFIVAAALIIVGTSMFVTAMSLVRWDFNMLSTAKYQTNEHVVENEFSDIYIYTDTAKIMFVPSANNEARVVCHEAENAKHTVEVNNGTLEIKFQDTRRWYDHITFFGSDAPTVTVYIPEGKYGSLKILTSTGDVSVHNQFDFKSADIKGSTAYVNYYAKTEGEVAISCSTGVITVEDISASSMELKVSTGKIELSNLNVSGDIGIEVSTGKAVVTGVTCNNFTSTGDTGKMNLTDVVSSGKISIKRSTGDVTLEACDAAEVYIKTSTGDVKATFLTSKIVVANTSTGRLDYPTLSEGGRCEITTSTGDVKVYIK